MAGMSLPDIPITPIKPIDEEQPPVVERPMPRPLSLGKRPFNPGEKVDNPDGSYSTERTVTVQSPDGSWMVVPSLWMGKNGPEDHLPEGDDRIAALAADYEKTTGKPFPKFQSLEEADRWAEERSAGGGASAVPITEAQTPLPDIPITPIKPAAQSPLPDIPITPILSPQTVTQDVIKKDPAKMGAIRDYMTDRKGVDWATRSDDEVMDAFMSHMRFVNTNEVSTVGELRYTMQADDNQKARTKAAYDVYDDMSSFLTNEGPLGAVEGAWDYTKAALLSPSTYVGGLIGGRLATTTIKQGTKDLILRAALGEAKRGGGAQAANEVIKAATKTKVRNAVIAGTLVDSSASSVQDYMYQLSRMNVGAQDEFSYAENAIALTGGLVGGAFGYGAAASHGLSGLDAMDIKLKAAKRIRRANAPKAVAEKLKASVTKMGKDLEDWKSMIEKGAPVLKDPMEEAVDKVKWFFDVDDPNSVVRILVDSGADLDPQEGVRFTEQVINYAKELPQETLDEYNDILAPTGLKFGQIMDYVAKSESVAGGMMSDASKAARFARDFANISAATRQVDEDIVTGTADLMNVDASADASNPQTIRYITSVWRRLLVSHPTTSALNVIGWSQAYGARTAAQMMHGGVLGLTGYAGKLAGAKWGDKNLSRANALWKNQIYKSKMVLDPYSTVDGFLAMVDKLPSKMQRDTVKAYFGGVQNTGAAEIYKMNPKNFMVKSAEKVSDIAARATLVKFQDVVTKSYSAISELDKISRLSMGKGVDDLVANGETHLLTEDMWQTAIDAMLKDTFSVDHTRAKGGWNKFAGLVEDISNAPGVGFLFPFGRFMNNNLAFAYEYSPLAFIGLGSKIYKSKGKALANFTVQEKVSRAMVGTVALATVFANAQDAMDKGLQWYQTEDSTGSVVTKQNIAPENVYRIFGRIWALHHKGEGIPPELWAEALNVLGPGQWTRQLDGKNPFTEIVQYMSSASKEDQGEVFNWMNTLVKPVAGIAAGFTRPLDFPNKFIAMGTGSDVAIDRRQADSLGDTIKQELTRYTYAFFAPVIGDNKAEDGSDIIGIPKMAATRPEGDIRDPNPYSSLLSRRTEPPMNDIDKLLGMVNLPPFIMDSRTAVPQFDHFVNKEVAPILNRKAKQALDDPIFKRMPQNEKVKWVRDLLTDVREEVIQGLGDGEVGGVREQVNYERRKFTALNGAEREIAKKELGITAKDNDLSMMQIEVLRDYMEERKKFNQYLRDD